MDNRFFDIIKHTTEKNSPAATSLINAIVEDKVSDMIKQHAREYKLPLNDLLKT